MIDAPLIADRPFSLFNIELTNHCIMKCVMCPRTNNMTRGRGYIDFELFRKAVDELTGSNPSFRDRDVLWLHHFGESLLHPEFGTCIRYASAKGIRTGLSVNPLMLTGDVADELLSAGPHMLYLSLDGHDDESFRAIRGVPDAYERSKELLIKFLEMKIKKSCRTIMVLSLIDFDLNRPGIAAAQESWGSAPGLDRILVKSFTRWDGGAADINALAAPESNRGHDRSVVRCTLPWEAMTVTWDGCVVPCCFDYNKKYVLGSLTDSTLSEIWNGGRMKALRSEFIGNSVTNSLCENCERLYMPRSMVTL